MRRKVVALLAVVLATAGCGSTAVPTSGPQGTAGDAGLGVANGSPVPGAVSAAGGSLPGAAGALGSGGGATVGTAGTSAGGTVAAAGGSVAPAGSAAAPNAPIKLGVVVGDATAVLAAFGKTGPSDIFEPWRAQITYINSHGGIAGHKIVPYYIRVDGASQDGDTAAEAACASATQDDKVNVVVTNGLGLESFLSCLQHAGVSSFDNTPWVADHVFLAAHPNFFAPDAISVERYAQALIKVSVARGILKKGDKLGVLTEDCPWGPRVYNNVIVPLAKSYGIGTDTASFSCIKSLSGQEIESASQSSQQAALKFRSSGVTHVMAVTAAEGFVIVQMQTNASQQKWYPKYLITTNAFPYNNGRRDGAVMFQSDALTNMSGIGFQPLIDIGDQAKPVSTAQATQQAACRAMDATQGGATSDTSKTHWQTLNAFYSICDQMLTLKQTLETDGLRFDMGSLNAGFQQVLKSGVSAVASVGSFAPVTNRRDGLGQVQAFSWNANTQHFTYTGQHYAVD